MRKDAAYIWHRVAERPRVAWGVIAALGVFLMFAPIQTPILWLMEAAEWAERGSRGMPYLRPIGWLASAVDHLLYAVGGVVMFTPFWGAAVWWVGVCGLWLQIQKGRRADVLATLVALGGNVLLALTCVPFFYAVPAGASIRPMAWAAWTFVTAGWTALAVYGVGVYALFRERRFVWIAVATPLVVECFLISGQLLRYAAHVKGFELSE